MTSQRKKWTHWLIVAAKILMVVMLCGFIYRAFISGNETLTANEWRAEPEWLVLAGVLYLLGLLPAAIFWRQVCVRAGQDVGLAEGIRAYYISQLGKYVPGKWMVILLRRTMLRSPKVETTVIAASIFFETFTMLAVGAALAGVLLVLWRPEQRLLIAAAIGAALLLGVPTVPRYFQWLLGVLRVTRLNPTVGAKFGHIGRGTMAVGSATMSVGWLLQGMSLWATLRAMGVTEAGPLDELSLHTAAVALGVVAGFISQIPGGLVMREWISGELLEPHYRPSVALISTIIFRLVLLVSELVLSIILYAVGWRRSRASVAAIETELSALGNG